MWGKTSPKQGMNLGSEVWTIASSWGRLSGFTRSALLLHLNADLESYFGVELHHEVMDLSLIHI